MLRSPRSNSALSGKSTWCTVLKLGRWNIFPRFFTSYASALSDFVTLVTLIHSFATYISCLNRAAPNVYNANECNFTRRFLIFKINNAERYKIVQTHVNGTCRHLEIHQRWMAKREKLRILAFKNVWIWTRNSVKETAQMPLLIRTAESQKMKVLQIPIETSLQQNRNFLKHFGARKCLLFQDNLN